MPAQPAGAAPVVTSGAAATAAGLTPTVDAFRAMLGPVNPNVAGSFGSGRREINWDGVPDAFAAPNPLPGNFFNVNSPRGVLLTTPGVSVQVSAIAPPRFGEINPTYPAQFATFSPQRLFSGIGSNIVDLFFFVPGTSIPATVSGFGALFTDVDLPTSTSLEFFDPNGFTLGAFSVPPLAGSATLSFLGVRFDAGERIARVRIVSGNAALGPDDTAALDLVVMDDFIYAEPQALAGAICAAPPASGTPLPGYNMILSSPGVVTVGTAGADLIYGTPGADRIAGLGGNDLLIGDGGDDQLSGGEGDDTLCGGAGSDLLSGDAGNDDLSGDGDNDDLAGGSGNDTLSGGTGVDRLVGGTGTDTCSGGGEPADAAAPAPSCDTIT